MSKYVLLPGYVRSNTDGDVHWIGPRQLAALYGVPFTECRVALRPNHPEEAPRDGEIPLPPLRNWDYKAYLKNAEQRKCTS